MTRKFCKHLHVIYENTEQLFRAYKVSSVVYTMIPPTGDRTSDYRTQSRNSTTELMVHIVHRLCQINLLFIEIQRSYTTITPLKYSGEMYQIINPHGLVPDLVGSNKCQQHFFFFLVRCQWRF